MFKKEKAVAIGGGPLVYHLLRDSGRSPASPCPPSRGMATNRVYAELGINPIRCLMPLIQNALSENIPPCSHYQTPCGVTGRSRCWKRAPSLLLESKFFTEVSQSY